MADRQWELSYQLQKAAFDLQKAAQSGGNSNYYSSGSGSPYYPKWNYLEAEPADEVSSADSAATAEIVNWKIR